MSVRTTADERIESAREHVNEAYKDLLVVMNPDTWGHDEFKEEYLDEIAQAMLQLLEIKRKL